MIETCSASDPVLEQMVLIWRLAAKHGQFKIMEYLSGRMNSNWKYARIFWDEFVAAFESAWTREDWPVIHWLWNRHPRVGGYYLLIHYCGQTSVTPALEWIWSNRLALPKKKKSSLEAQTWFNQACRDNRLEMAQWLWQNCSQIDLNDLFCSSYPNTETRQWLQSL